MFTLLVCVLMMLFLMAGVAGFRQSRYPDQPPAPASIPYANLQLTAESMGYQVQLDPATVALVRDDRIIGYGCDPSRPKDNPRLVVLAMTREITYGWPVEFFNWRWTTAWDVTDPNQTFVPARGYWKPYTFWKLDALAKGVPRDDGAGFSGGQITWFALAAAFMLSQLMAAVAVFAASSFFALRERRRQRRQQCLLCGYAKVRADYCSECGTAPAAAMKHRLRERPARLFAFAFVALLIAYAIACASLPVVVKHDVAAELAKFAQQSKTNGVAGQSPVRPVVHSCRSYGLPWPVIETIERSVYVIAPSGNTSGAIIYPPTSGLQWMPQESALYWDALDSDLTTIRSKNFNVAIALITFCVLEFLALLIVLPIAWSARSPHR